MYQLHYVEASRDLLQWNNYMRQTSPDIKSKFLSRLSEVEDWFSRLVCHIY